MSFKRFPEAAIISPDILAEPLKFPNGRFAKNRFMKAAMTERLATYNHDNLEKHGVPTQKYLNCYDKWGHGEFGMVVTGNVIVDSSSLEAIGNACIFKEGDSLERRSLFIQVAQKMKQDGALAIMQLALGGRQTSVWVNPTPYGASDVALITDPVMYGKPVALTTEQVQTEVIDRFVYATKFAFDCGFDGVQLHAAHGYLLSTFTSPTTNNRTDQYGGSLENRNRVIMEIYEKIREEIPESSKFLVGIKANSKEFQEKGITVEEARAFCEVYEKHGFDFVELTGGTAEKYEFVHHKESTRVREAFFVEFADAIRPALKNTVLYLTGGFRTAGAMIDAVRRNTTQGIGLARPVTAEPDLPKKIINGSVPSAIKDGFGDIISQMMASGSQLEQMSRTSFEEAGGNVMDQISDYSDEKMVDLFHVKMAEFFKNMKRDAMAGKAPKTVVIMD